MRQRRKSERFGFSQPASVVIAGQRGTLIDLSVRGASILHDSPLRVGRSLRLELLWKGETIVIDGEVTSCKFEVSHGRPRYRTGVAVSDAVSERIVRRIMIDLVSEEIAQRRRDAHLSAAAVSA